MKRQIEEDTRYVVNSKISGTAKEYSKRLKNFRGDQIKALQSLIADLKDEVTTLEKLQNALSMAESFSGIETKSKEEIKSTIQADGNNLSVEGSPHVLKYLHTLGLITQENI